MCVYLFAPSRGQPLCFSLCRKVVFNSMFWKTFLRSSDLKVIMGFFKDRLPEIIMIKIIFSTFLTPLNSNMQKIKIY